MIYFNTQFYSPFSLFIIHFIYLFNFLASCYYKKEKKNMWEHNMSWVMTHPPTRDRWNEWALRNGPIWIYKKKTYILMNVICRMALHKQICIYADSVMFLCIQIWQTLIIKDHYLFNHTLNARFCYSSYTNSDSRLYNFPVSK